MPELPSTVEEALASGEWKEVVDPQTGRKYYHNKKTRMTTYNLKRTLQELMEKQKEQERKEKYAQRVRSQRAKEEEDGNVDGAPAALRQPDMGNNNGNSNSTKAAEGPSTISKKSPPTAKVKEESDNAVEKSAFRGKRGTAPVPPPVGIESAEDAVSGGPPKPDESVESLLSRVDHALSGNVRDGNEDPKQGESHVDVALALSNFNDTEEDVQRFLQHWIGSDPGHLRNHVETLQLAERRVSLAEARNQVLTSELEDTRKKLAAANETIAKLEHTLYKTQCCLYYGTSDVRGPAALTHPRATRAQAEAIRAKRREQYTAVLPAHSIAHQGASSLCKEDIYERAAYLQETVATLQELNCRLRSELDHVRASRPCDYCTKHRLRNRTDPALPEPEIAWITDRVRGTQHLPSVAQMLCPHHLDTFLTLDRPMEEADDSQVSAVPWSPHTGPQKRCHVYPSHPLYDDRQTEGRYLIPQNGFPSYVTLAANPFRVGSMMKF